MIRVNEAPKLSVVVVSFNGPRLLERCLMSLEQQTMKDGIEVLVVASRDLGRGAIEELKRRFPRIRWESDPQRQTVPQLRSLGVARSRGDVIAFLEDDCVASEAWCGSLLSVHRAPWPAVGGAVEPGPYGHVFDWAMYFVEYAPFMQPLPHGDGRALPGTNVSYKRTALAQLSPEWTDVPGAGNGLYEVFLHQALKNQRQPLRLDPAMVVHNVNCWAPWTGLVLRFHHGRGFAGIRVAGRPIRARMAFLGIAVVLPLIQSARIMKEVITRRRHVWRAGLALPWILLLSLSWSLGEFAGYLLGPGSSPSRWR